MQIRTCVVVLLGTWIILSIMNPGLSAAEECEPTIATAVSVQGRVEMQRAGASDWMPVLLNAPFCPGDQIRVMEDSRAELALANQSVMRLNAGSTMILEGIENETSTVVNIGRGAAHFFSRVFKGLRVKTPFMTAGVRGTEFFVGVGDAQTEITIFEGGVLATNDAGELSLSSGQSAVAQAGRPPALRVVARPRDAVQWALYYPPVLSTTATPAQPAGADALVRQAAQKLSVGQVESAESDLARASEMAPANGDVLALQSIIALVRNDKQKALSLADQAVQADPKSATPLIARSYAQQASFDLENARQSLQQAVSNEPENALAWARLAELHMSFGELDNALTAANKAVAIEPDLARSQTVLGFARLLQVKTKSAREAFNKAIERDQADPLPRLGLGLAIIRDGDLAAGRAQLEIAASLDPNNSLVRSYLGKAYYEEKNEKFDGREFAEAKKLDPQDPTPWFYDAIRKQSINRPVEALEDLQTAMELNDNRAVYRSKLMLDSDQAARSASLARIYSDLGFQQRALIEGYTSLNTDPTNYSAHRFLADSYSALPRHEISRVSELLQSQLLQPNNITPIQPGLAESNQFLLGTQGPAALSFNEYNPLFNRNRTTVQASGLAGSNDTWAGEGIAAGIYDRLSLSAGYTHYETDGFRTNDSQEDDIANIFAQYELSYKTSVQAEFRYRDIALGDTQMRFFEDDFRPDRREDIELKTWRLGFHHAFAPSSRLIGNFTYQKGERGFFDIGIIDAASVGFPPPDLQAFVNTQEDADSYSGEVAHIFRSQYINTYAGVGYFKIDNTVALNQDIIWAGLVPPVTLQSDAVRTDQTVDHSNVYLYSYLHPFESMTVTVGASADFFKLDQDDSDLNDLDENQFNPKIGLSWTAPSGTTLRGAAFRTFKRTLITNQTLEPTQVAGFNQFYDDGTATEAWVYGLGVDQKFSQTLFAGVEGTYRDMSVPWFFTPDPPAAPVPQLMSADWEEKVARFYLNWAPVNWGSVTAGYAYEKFDRAEEFNFNIQRVETHMVPLGVNVFLPSGINAAVKATYYDQKGVFQREKYIDPGFEEGEDQFWVVDAAVSYRLPKRYGIVTVGANNLFDEKFEYADTDIRNPHIQPERFVYGKFTIEFP